MPKPTDLDARIATMTAIVGELALASAAEAKGSALSAEEVEGVQDWVAWWVFAIAQGMDVTQAADAMRAEAKGTATVH